MIKGKVSVIIPTYNRSEYINRAIDSVLSQTYKNLEVIVVDDNNPNSEGRKNTIKKMKKYEKNTKVKYICHERNKNGAAARNTGINISDAEYITFLDDDDYFLPKRIEIIVNQMNENREFDGAYTGVIITENLKIKKVLSSGLEGNLQKNILMQKSFFGTGSNLFFRALALKNINGFDESFQRHQDLEVLVRFFEQYKIKAVDSYSVVKCENDRQNVPNIEKTIIYRKKFLDEFEEIIKKNNPQDIYSENYFHLLKLAIRSGKNYNEIKVREFMKGYSAKLSQKMKFKLFIEKTNRYIKIIELYRLIRKFTYKNKLNGEQIQFIKEMENVN